MIPKKTQPTCKDLRPIALTNTAYKIYMALCKEKLTEHLMRNDQFNKFQSGFTRGRRLEDNLLVLSFCINESRVNKNPLYICAIDFEKAFDSIKRSQIVKVLIKYRCDPLFIDMISELYQNDYMSVYFDGKLMGELQATSGIRQGCTGSLLVFILVVNYIIERVEKLKIGFRSASTVVSCLFFADDGLLMADNENKMIRMLKVLEDSADEIGIKINKSKCNLLIYGQDNKPEHIQNIKVTESIKYLGVCVGNERDIYQLHNVKGTRFPSF